MRTSAEFVEILDEYLKSKGLTRRQFCNLTDIPESTIGTWKSKNVMPSVELVAKVAKFINVSLDWLVYGEIDEIDNHIINDTDYKLFLEFKQNFSLFLEYKKLKKNILQGNV